MYSLRNALTDFQKKYGIYELPEQAYGYFSMLELVTQKKIESEIKLEILNKRVNTSSNTYQQAKNEFDIIKNKLNNLYHDNDTNDIILNFEKLPEIGKKYFNLQKGLEIQKQILQTVVPIYEQAKMEEAKALPLVTVVDSPTTPKKKKWPPRSAITILGALSAFLFCLIYYLIKLNYIKNKDYYKYIVE